MIGKCEYCKAENNDLRPYGKNGAFICFSCGMKPENISETRNQFHEIIKDVDEIIIINGVTLQ